LQRFEFFTDSAVNIIAVVIATGAAAGLPDWFPSCRFYAVERDAFWCGLRRDAERSVADSRSLRCLL